MDLWDRISDLLRARRISVEDVSKKHDMALRLLHGAAYGHTWFGRWGYKFCRGSYGVSEKNYDRAIEILSSLELDKVIQDFSEREQWRQIKGIIQHYRDLSESQLVTMRDLLKFVLTIKSRSAVQNKLVAATSSSAPSASTQKNAIRVSFHKKGSLKEKSSKCKRFTSVIGHMDSRWPPKRLEYAAEVIVDALKEHKSTFSHGGMTRQDLRDAARMHIGDTGLLDYVLKSMNNVIFGSHIVRRSTNTARILEYTIEVVDNGKGAEAQRGKPQHQPQPDALPDDDDLVPGTDVYNDVVYLYNNVLINYPDSELLQLATQVVLDSKHFVKDRPFKDEDDQLLRFFCQVAPGLIDADQDTLSSESLPASELVILPLHATVLDLKQAVERALRDTYCILDKLVVTDIDNLGNLEDGDVLFGALESGAEILVRASGIELDSKLRHEGGAENWIVRCECGAQDDDGERMVACDICEVWQHTRCCGIDDSEAVPPLFVCPGCCASIGPPMTMTMTESPLAFQNCDDLLLDSPIPYEYGNDIALLP
ncbi:Zinc finger, PHD-type [Corchorus olitorius]|uniref:Zinc finger, PHD-type n=1 Tax=Corchorus olitorius TaxID=93759 RepID=A0A1R3GGH0_9ROSI|nr:Zinc finger, PHD-type [Corchorus olitorius]